MLFELEQRLDALEARGALPIEIQIWVRGARQFIALIREQIILQLKHIQGKVRPDSGPGQSLFSKTVYCGKCGVVDVRHPNTQAGYQMIPLALVAALMLILDSLYSMDYAMNGDQIFGL